MKSVQLEAIENEIRAGHLESAKTKLIELSKHARIKDSVRLHFCNLARRLNLPFLALKILHPIVRPTGRIKKIPTSKETLEYAASLTKAGACKEALDLLNTLDPRQDPEIYLYRAFAVISWWDYSQAISHLEQYLKTPALSDYTRLIGLVNLAASLVHEEKEEAESTLLNTLDLSQGKYEFIYAHTLKLMAEHMVNRKNWKSAKHYLALAENTLQHASPLEKLLVKKWNGIIRLYEYKNRKQVTSLLNPIRKKALQLKHWETLRDCDFHEMVVTQSRPLFDRLHFGTPYESYRKRLRQINHSFDIPPYYDWVLNHKKGKPKRLDLFSSGAQKRFGLKAGQQHFRLLSVLVSDFYRPFRVLQIYGQLFPDEYFNISSTNRIHQTIKRLREHLSQKQIPLSIEEIQGFYKLIPTRNCVVRIPSQNTTAPTHDVFLKEFAERHHPQTSR